jgi:DNA helicase-2/ATP-dependent DNA helicase PcrA
MSPAPHLTGEALNAVKHRGSHLQIIASAGSGKTEVVSQRVADLLAEGLPARAITAFTFTERAAEELRQRIELRAAERIGPSALDQIGGLFVGTIHAYCFRLLQQRVPRYETYDVLDENQLTAFLSREAKRLEIRQLDPADRNRLFAAIETFLHSVDVVENELLDPAAMPEPFGTILAAYYDTLDRYRLLTYGQQIVRAVQELADDPMLQKAVRAELLHLIVDEYQDVNPAQERLIELLAGPDTSVCVVGDDDQAIYQWRGSDVGNIVTFTDRYPNVETFEITTNRRSRPQIIKVANAFATTIPGRLDKVMGTHRSSEGKEADVVAWFEDDELAEAGWIANLVLDFHEQGVPYRDMAVLVRGRAAYRRLVDQFGSFDIPVQPGGRTGLFDTPIARTLGHTYCWLAGIDWRDTYGPGRPISEQDLLHEYENAFRLSPPQVNRLRRLLREWEQAVPREDRTADLVGELYELLRELDVRAWDLADTARLSELGTLARFSSLLADYESVRRRARPDAEIAGEQVGGQDRGSWYYKNLAIHIVNYAQGAYEDFDGEPDFALDAVDLTTVHRAKGLEWPVVFVPSLTARRFPSGKTGSRQSWLVPREVFEADRYEGSDADERRLFYVAATRARDWLSLSRHATVTTKAAAPSPYWLQHQRLQVSPDRIELPAIESPPGNDDDPISITYSELASFLDCGMAYRLRNLVGFQPRLAPELGYGKAVHHVMRTVAERTRDEGVVPDEQELDRILDESFFLPTANKPAHRNLKAAARRLVTTYAEEHAEDLHRVWETERPFELHLDGVTVTGRADVILDQEDGVPTALAIVDYKTSTSDDKDKYALQLQVYADAGRREGLDVRGAYIHDLKARAGRDRIDVSPEVIGGAEATVQIAARRLRAGDYAANPGSRCRKCEVRTVCRSAEL